MASDKKKLEDDEYVSSDEIRSYLRYRVYFFLLIQLLAAASLIWAIFHVPSLYTMLQNNLDVLYIAEITAVVCLFMLSMYEEVRCDSDCGSPVNLVTLGIYTICLAVHACGTVYLYTGNQVQLAMLITGLAFLGLSQVAFYSSHDFYVAGGNAVMFTFIFRFISHLFSNYTVLVFMFKILNFLITCVDIISDTQALQFVQCKDYVLSCATLYFNVFHMFSCTLDLMPLPVQEGPSVLSLVKHFTYGYFGADYSLRV